LADVKEGRYITLRISLTIKQLASGGRGLAYETVRVTYIRELEYLC